MELKTSKLVYELKKRAQNLTIPMRYISADMIKKVNLRFRRTQDQDGKEWARLSPATIARRRKASDKPLNDTGRLKSSFRRKYTRNSAIVGTNTIYAPTHQFGARKGQYGKTRYGVAIPWGKIPARPFLGINRKERMKYRSIVLRYLKKGNVGGGENINV